MPILNFSLNKASLEGAVNCFSVEDIGKVVDDGECQEVHILDNLEMLPDANFEQTITLLVRKLKVGGLLILKGLNMRAVCREYLRDNIEHDIMSKLIFGLGEVKRRRMLPIEALQEVLQHAGCNLVQKSLDGYYYFLVGERVS